MRVIDLVNLLTPIAQKEPQLQIVVRGMDDRGNEIDIKPTGALRLETDRWGLYILLK